FTNGSLQNSNWSESLQARGVPFPPKINYIYDVGGSLRGPFQQDKVCFFTAHRVWDSNQQIPINFNKTQHTIFYTPDLERPGYAQSYSQDHTLRVTWQASRGNKFNLGYSIQNACLCY